jgi:hypothetical protein
LNLRLPFRLLPWFPCFEHQVLLLRMADLPGLEIPPLSRSGYLESLPELFALNLKIPTPSRSPFVP